MKKLSKTLTVFLAATSSISLILSLGRSEEIKILFQYVTIISTIALAIKQFIEQSGLYTAEEVAQFSNFEKDNATFEKMSTATTAQDVKNWKSNGYA